jgi:A/G-specific adenine glycosylase
MQEFEKHIEYSEVAGRLIKWFHKNERFFPWRDTSDPFKILIAERLLQQTRANDSVVRAYCEITEKYPDPYSLSQANIKILENIIQPLGLLFRAHQLKKMGTEIVEQFESVVPDNYEDLISLTGVGEYAANAVLSFAYLLDTPVVDINVGRFIYRLYGIKKPVPVNPSRKKYLKEIASSFIPPGKSRDYNLAIIDLCAAICTSTNPKCKICPVLQYCEHGNSLSV